MNINFSGIFVKLVETIGVRGSVVGMALYYKPEGNGFET
jgi:hypothetical protein